MFIESLCTLHSHMTLFHFPVNAFVGSFHVNSHSKKLFHKNKSQYKNIIIEGKVSDIL